MSRLKDITGERFGRWTVMARAPNGSSNQAMWLCQCDCGSEPKVVSGSDLRIGRSLSCGCLHNEQLAAMRTTHHMTGERLYNIWKGMRQRCCNINNPAYEDYGGRGITICDEWLSDFTVFARWAREAGYSDELSIDRIDVNRGYCPDNCRWADDSIQCNNRRTNRYITIDGRTQTLKEWCVEYQISYRAALHRINNLGWDALESLTRPIRRCNNDKGMRCDNGYRQDECLNRVYERA